MPSIVTSSEGEKSVSSISRFNQTWYFRLAVSTGYHSKSDEIPYTGRSFGATYGVVRYFYKQGIPTESVYQSGYHFTQVMGFTHLGRPKL